MEAGRQFSSAGLITPLALSRPGLSAVPKRGEWVNRPSIRPYAGYSGLARFWIPGELNSHEVGIMPR